MKGLIILMLAMFTGLSINSANASGISLQTQVATNMTEYFNQLDYKNSTEAISLTIDFEIDDLGFVSTACVSGGSAELNSKFESKLVGERIVNNNLLWTDYSRRYKIKLNIAIE